MNIHIRQAIAAVTAAAAATIAFPAAAAYPERPVRLVVGFPPGGAADILGRIAAQQLSERIGQQVVVDNRGGAGGLIATEIAAKANSDGYTLLFSSIPHVINPHLYKKVSYDAIRDFTPVVQFVAVPLMLAAGPSLPAKNVKELIDYAKANPGKINYGSAGSGSSSHLAVELFKSMAAIRMEHIPYKGTGPLITDMLGGQIGVTIASAVPLTPQVRSGKLRGLAVTGPKRSAAFPELPAIAETVPGYEVVNWFGIFAPAGTPMDIVKRVNADLNTALKNPELVKRLNAQGADAVGGSAEAFTRVVKADFAKWAKVVKDSGAKVE
ncbi:MAG: tripartite tricarboxylate transporter substrate binding protein [Burkholderiales bacterium]|nr:tripartite tricarboxylate transporter substrate binding protein [Burkholderiales bacterium]MDP2397673.1 tripartite tricarboxylate transporter substrate binding protein [Burkholderiales bacterium]